MIIKIRTHHVLGATSTPHPVGRSECIPPEASEGGGGEITVRTRTLTSSVFIVVTEVCVDGPAELQDVIPLVLIHPLVLGLLWKEDCKMCLGGGVKGFPQIVKSESKHLTAKTFPEHEQPEDHGMPLLGLPPLKMCRPIEVNSGD